MYIGDISEMMDNLGCCLLYTSLKPIEYDEYKDMKTKDIAALVKERIEEKIKEILG